VLLSVLVGLVSVVLLMLLSWQAALGYLGGALVGAGMLAALVFCAEGLVVAPGDQPPRRWPYLLLHAAKFAGAIGIAVLLVVVLKASAAAFAAGYGTALVGFLVRQSRASAAGPAGTPGRQISK
jgi:hypothetical protein